MNLIVLYDETIASEEGIPALDAYSKSDSSEKGGSDLASYEASETGMLATESISACDAFDLRSIGFASATTFDKSAYDRTKYLPVEPDLMEKDWNEEYQKVYEGAINTFEEAVKRSKVLLV